jgi:hypothetical protein
MHKGVVMDPRHVSCGSRRSLVAFVALSLAVAPACAPPPEHGHSDEFLATGIGHPVTYTCVPRGSGERIGVDRDGDGAWDGDERDAHTDPANPASRP